MDTQSDLRKKVLKQNLPPFHPQSHSSRAKRQRKDYSPLTWDNFFDRHSAIKDGKNSYQAYFRGSSGPVLLMLHGGGHSALSWAAFAVEITRLVDCQVVAVDSRGHGDTYTEDDSDLSADTLSKDVVSIIRILYGEAAPPIVLVGHSMGGAIAVRAAATSLIPTLVGIAVIDLVEGTAMDSLSSTQSFLRERPSTFKSLEHAIEWSIRSGQIRNLDSARVSMPGQLKIQVLPCESSATSTHQFQALPMGSLAEEEEADHEEAVGREESGTDNDAADSKTSKTETSAEQGSSSVVSWRVDLSKTECYWKGWFQGLSKLFLSSSVAVPKLLILAGVDRLDKDLTIGQMQGEFQKELLSGKFQMEVLSGCGHAVHEDQPSKVAEILAAFLIRLKVVEGFKTSSPQ